MDETIYSSQNNNDKIATSKSSDKAKNEKLT